MPLTKFTIHIIRDADKHNDTGCDDVASIQRIGADQFTLSYTDGQSKKNRQHETLTLTGRATFKWMRLMLGLMELDAEPFANIQIMQPCMPAILLPVKRIDAAYTRILDALEFYLDNSEYVCMFDEKAEAETDDEMPPLVSVEQDNYNFAYATPTPTYTNSRHLFFDEDREDSVEGHY